MKQVLILMRRHGNLLLCSLVLSATFASVDSHAARALVGIDPQTLLRHLEPSSLLGGEKKIGKSSTTDKKGTTSDPKASPSRASPPSNSLQSPASTSIPLQGSASDLAPLPTVDTSLLPYLDPAIPRGLLVRSNAALPGAMVRESGAPVLTASAQGWKVAGLAWYWWLTALALVVGAGRWGLRYLGSRAGTN